MYTNIENTVFQDVNQDVQDFNPKIFTWRI